MNTKINSFKILLFLSIIGTIIFLLSNLFFFNHHRKNKYQLKYKIKPHKKIFGLKYFKFGSILPNSIDLFLKFQGNDDEPGMMINNPSINNDTKLIEILIFNFLSKEEDILKFKEEYFIENKEIKFIISLFLLKKEEKNYFYIKNLIKKYPILKKYKKRLKLNLIFLNQHPSIKNENLKLLSINLLKEFNRYSSSSSIFSFYFSNLKRIEELKKNKKKILNFLHLKMNFVENYIINLEFDNNQFEFKNISNFNQIPNNFIFSKNFISFEKIKQENLNYKFFKIKV